MTFRYLLDLWYHLDLYVPLGIAKDLWNRQGLMVLTIPIVLTKTHGIESVILNHTRTRGPSVTRMRDFFLHKSLKLSKIVLVLRSASVERFDVSRMRDFFIPQIQWSYIIALIMADKSII